MIKSRTASKLMFDKGLRVNPEMGTCLAFVYYNPTHHQVTLKLSAAETCLF